MLLTKLSITVSDLEEAFDGPLPDECKELIQSLDLTYEIPDNNKHYAIMLDSLQKIESDKQIIGSIDRQAAWSQGWSENLKELEGGGSEYRLLREALVPKFIKCWEPLRWHNQYIIPRNPNFHLAFLRVFLTYLFRTYFDSVDNLYEFGCGTGFNLFECAQLYSNKKYMGLDYVQSAIDCVKKIGFEGRLFDFTRPDLGLNLPVNTGVLTFGAIEQTAGHYTAFLQYLLQQRPAIVVNVEPTIELYDASNIFDYIAMQFHRKRRYTIGYLPRLQQLEQEKRIEILKVKRTGFGSQMMEGYTFMAWRPI